MTFRTLNSGNYGMFNIIGDAGFIPSTVGLALVLLLLLHIIAIVTAQTMAWL